MGTFFFFGGEEIEKIAGDERSFLKKVYVTVLLEVFQMSTHCFYNKNHENVK